MAMSSTRLSKGFMLTIDSIGLRQLSACINGESAKSVKASARASSNPWVVCGARK